MGLRAAAAIAAGVALAGWAIRDNFWLTVTRHTVGFEELPEEFDGFKIVQVSDLHNARFGKDQSRLMAAIRTEKPDLIAITGDLFHTLRRENAYSFLGQAAKLAPCYYVSGNHEQRFADYFTAIRPKLEDLGAVVLDDESARIIRGESHITAIGLADPSFERNVPPERLTDEKLSRLVDNESGFTLLLSHRPELFPVYARHNVSLALTGHAHGGQVRFAKRGLFAVNQGWLPKYTEGIFVENNTKMVVSRSLGNSTLYPKVNDPPELVSVQLTVLR